MTGNTPLFPWLFQAILSLLMGTISREEFQASVSTKMEDSNAFIEEKVSRLMEEVDDLVAWWDRVNSLSIWDRMDFIPNPDAKLREYVAILAEQLLAYFPQDDDADEEEYIPVRRASKGRKKSKTSPNTKCANPTVHKTRVPKTAGLSTQEAIDDEEGSSDDDYTTRVGETLGEMNETSQELKSLTNEYKAMEKERHTAWCEENWPKVNQLSSDMDRLAQILRRLHQHLADLDNELVELTHGVTEDFCYKDRMVWENAYKLITEVNLRELLEIPDYVCEW